MADLRQACDRCHDKKLRCPKQLSSLACNRCAKAGVDCVFSPPTRSLRSGAIGSGEQQHLDAAAFDWSSLLNFGQPSDGISHGIPNGIPNGVPNQSPNPIVTTPPISDSADAPPLSKLAELAQIMATLDRIYRDFPTSPVHRHMSIAVIKEYSSSTATRFDMQSTLEHLMQQGQQLADLYPQVINEVSCGVNRPPEDHLCTISDCMHHLRQSLRPRPPPILDHSLLNLLIACHMRLIDIFDSLMDHSRVCAHVFSTLLKDREPNFDIPEIRIGSFVAPKDSSASIVIAMLVELQSSLEVRGRELSKSVITAAGETSLQSRIVVLQCEALSQRATDTLGDIRDLRAKLFSSGILG